MRQDGKIDYVEFPGDNLPALKLFYGLAFGWRFVDLSPGYTAFDGAGAEGGCSSNPQAAPAKPRVLVYAHDIDRMLARVRAAGGVITQPIFAYPGGRRFYFRDPCGNELGVWTECWDPIPAPRPILDRPAWPWRREARRRAREAGRLFSSPRP